MQSVTMSGSDLPGNLVASIGIGPRVGVAQPVAAQGPTKPVRVSAGVAQGMLLAPFHPVYPPIAIAARVEGTVVVQAVISKSGLIESLHVASGPPLLTSAALDAIRAARYAPYRLSGEPVEVETTISVITEAGELAGALDGGFSVVEEGVARFLPAVEAAAQGTDAGDAKLVQIHCYLGTGLFAGAGAVKR